MIPIRAKRINSHPNKNIGILGDYFLQQLKYFCIDTQFELWHWMGTIQRGMYKLMDNTIEWKNYKDVSLCIQMNS